jgi:hypothetical protein
MNPRYRKPAVNLQIVAGMATSAVRTIEEAVDAAAVVPADKADIAAKIAVRVISRDAPKAAAPSRSKAVRTAANRAAKANTAASAAGVGVAAADVIAAKAGVAAIAARDPKASRAAARSERQQPTTSRR